MPSVRAAIRGRKLLATGVFVEMRPVLTGCSEMLRLITATLIPACDERLASD
jgi:hypothetical protein